MDPRANRNRSFSLPALGHKRGQALAGAPYARPLAGSGKHVFCLREHELPETDEMLEEVERVNIAAFNEQGSPISVVLDRKRYERCDLLFSRSLTGRD